MVRVALSQNTAKQNADAVKGLRTELIQESQKPRA